MTVVGCSHFRKWWCFWLSSWPHRYFTLATVPFNLLWVFGLTQGPEMSVALGRWALKEVICQKPLTQLLLHSDLSLSRAQASASIPSPLWNPIPADCISIQCLCFRTATSRLVFWYLVCWCQMGICQFQRFAALLTHLNWHSGFTLWV